MSQMLTIRTFAALFVGLMLVMNVGGYLSASMMSGGDMQDCPYMGVVGLCEMTPIGHLALWQAITAAVPQPFSAMALLSVLMVVAVWLFLHKPDPRISSQVFLPRRRDSERVFDPLRLAFARGILNTKRF